MRNTLIFASGAVGPWLFVPVSFLFVLAASDLAGTLEKVSGISSYEYDWSLNDAAEPEKRK